MIVKTKIIEAVHERLREMPEDHYLDIRTYKRNRSVLIVKHTGDRYTVIENGYFKDRFQVNSEKLRKLMETLLKKEFPRSNKVRLYVMGEFNKEAESITRKIL